MKKFVVFAACALAGLVLADTVLKQNSTVIGPVKDFDCRGSGISCSRSGSVGYIFVDAGPTCGVCDAGYSLAADGGCAPSGSPCAPDNGLNADGGCACASVAAPALLCDAMASIMDGGWWCFNGSLSGGNPVMKTGSAINLYAQGAPVSVSWPVMGGGVTEDHIRLNDYSGGYTTWVDAFTSDAGQVAPLRAFSTCFLGAHAMRKQSDLASCAGSGITYMNFDGGFKWIQAFDATCTNGDQVVCRNGTPPASCNSAVNLAESPRRGQSLHCSTFLPGDGGANTGSTCAVTYVQGATTATSVCTTHAKNQIGPSPSGSWIVGGVVRGGAVYIDPFAGFIRGAGMTDGTALSTAQVTTIGQAVLPSYVLPGMTFTRPRFKQCCLASKCANVSPNVPCRPGDFEPNTSASNQQFINYCLNPEALQGAFTAGNAIDGGSLTPPTVAEDYRGPFGFTTMIKHTFSQTRIWDGGAGTPAISSGIQLSCAGPGTGHPAGTRYRCFAWVVGDPIDVCIQNGLDNTNSSCAVCTPPTSPNEPGQCFIEGTTTTIGSAFYLGHLNSLYPAGMGTAWNSGVVWMSHWQCTTNPYANDFSGMGTTVWRAAYSHNSMTCAP